MFNDTIWYKLWDGRWVRNAAIVNAFEVLNKVSAWEAEGRYIKFLDNLFKGGNIKQYKISKQFTIDEIASLAINCHKVMAITIYRDKYNTTLTDAKYVIDKLIENGGAKS